MGDGRAGAVSTASALVPRSINTTTFVASIFGSGEARRGSIPRSGAVTEEQRSQNRKARQPSGRRFFLAQTSLLAPYSPRKGMRWCPCGSTSRLVWAKNPSPQTWLYLWNGVLSWQTVETVHLGFHPYATGLKPRC